MPVHISPSKKEWALFAIGHLCFDKEMEIGFQFKSISPSKKEWEWCAIGHFSVYKEMEIGCQFTSLLLSRSEYCLPLDISALIKKWKLCASSHLSFQKKWAMCEIEHFCFDKEIEIVCHFTSLLLRRSEHCVPLDISALTKKWKLCTGHISPSKKEWAMRAIEHFFFDKEIEIG